MHAMTLAAQYIHTVTQDPWELLALVGPFGAVFGAGVILVIIPIVRAGGDRYQHRELRGDEEKPYSNGNGAGAHGATKAGKAADQATASTRWKN
jgi:hypothetical protein